MNIKIYAPLYNEVYYSLKDDMDQVEARFADPSEWVNDQLIRP